MKWIKKFESINDSEEMTQLEKYFGIEPEYLETVAVILEDLGAEVEYAKNFCSVTWSKSENGNILYKNSVPFFNIVVKIPQKDFDEEIWNRESKKFISRLKKVARVINLDWPFDEDVLNLGFTKDTISSRGYWIWEICLIGENPKLTWLEFFELLGIKPKLLGNKDGKQVYDLEVIDDKVLLTSPREQYAEHLLSKNSIGYEYLVDGDIESFLDTYNSYEYPLYYWLDEENKASILELLRKNNVLEEIKSKLGVTKDKDIFDEDELHSALKTYLADIAQEIDYEYNLELQESYWKEFFEKLDSEFLNLIKTKLDWVNKVTEITLDNKSYIRILIENEFGNYRQETKYKNVEELIDDILDYFRASNMLRIGTVYPDFDWDAYNKQLKKVLVNKFLT